MKVRITRTARQDIRDILRYTRREFGSGVMAELRQRLSSTFLSLAEFPGQGRPRPEFTAENVLFFPVHPFLVIYQVRAGEFYITGVVHAARDLPRHLG